jgi:hypothetical protein
MIGLVLTRLVPQRHNLGLYGLRNRRGRLPTHNQRRGPGVHRLLHKLYVCHRDGHRDRDWILIRV